jgi:hypothetical protein
MLVSEVPDSVLQPPPVGRVQLQQALLLEIFDDLAHCILDARLVALDLDLRALRGLVGRADAGEVGDLALPRLLVQALGVAGLGHLEREVDKDLDEGKRLVVGVRGLRRGVQLAGLLAVRLVGRDEGRDGDGGAVGEQLGDLDAAR